MHLIDLFSGIGGFALASQWAGWKFPKHYYSDIDKFCLDIYGRRFPHAKPLGPIQNITSLPEADYFITGGFPCQSVSSGGKRRGFDDKAKSGLWVEMARVIALTRPRWVLIENVRGLLSLGMDQVLADLAAMNYDAQWRVLAASELGAIHRRERVWIVAYPANEYMPPIFQDLDFSLRLPELDYQAVLSTGTYQGRPCAAPRTNIGRKRISALGNTIVPQVAAVVLKRIKEIDGHLRMDEKRKNNPMEKTGSDERRVADPDQD